MKLKISKRMQTIVDMCDYSDIIVDVGTDHGKVPITIANSNKAKKIIATDINSEPLKQCEKNAKEYLINKNFDFNTLVCDGLSKIDKNMACAIIISGMGYDLISNILSDIESYNFKYLIISPHTKINEFVRFISAKNLNIIEERTVYEDEKVYFIFKITK